MISKAFIRGGERTFRNFLDFAGAYEGAATYKLQTNYRSTPEILETANAVIAGNPEQFQKELRAVRPSGEAPSTGSYARWINAGSVYY